MTLSIEISINDKEEDRKWMQKMRSSQTQNQLCSIHFITLIFDDLLSLERTHNRLVVLLITQWHIRNRNNVIRQIQFQSMWLIEFCCLWTEPVILQTNWQFGLFYSVRLKSELKFIFTRPFIQFFFLFVCPKWRLNF